MSPSVRPVWMHTFREDLIDALISIVVFFFGSLVLWPIILIISIIFIPLTYVFRLLALSVSVPCSCDRCVIECHCRIFATAAESTWIRLNDSVLTHSEFRKKVRSATEKAKSGVKPNPRPADAESRVQDGAQSVSTEQLSPLMYQSNVSEDPLLTSVTQGRMLTGMIHSLVIVVDNSLNIEKLKNLIIARMIELRQTNSTKKYFPRFTQCLVRMAGGSLVWVDDPDFVLSKHMEVHPHPIPAQVDLENLLESKTRLGISVERPLWHLLIAQGYGGQKCTVLIWRFHGAMYDGITISKILTHTLSNPKLINFKKHSQYDLYGGHVMRSILIGPVRFLFLLMKKRRVLASSYETAEGDNTQKPVAHHGWSDTSLNLTILLKNKMMLNMSFNDLLIGLLTGAVRGDNPNSPIDAEETSSQTLTCNRLLVPFDMWVGHKNSPILPQGNQITMMPLNTSKCQEVVPRLWATTFLFSNLKRLGDARLITLATKWLHKLPLPRSASLAVFNKLSADCDALFTSFNGPGALDAIDGAYIYDMMYFAHPPQGIAHSYNFITYCGAVKLTSVSSQGKFLHSGTIHRIIQNMSLQLSVLNKMVFLRYFPDGITGSCLYNQSQASRVYAEFIKKLHEIENMEVTRTSQEPIDDDHISITEAPVNIVISADVLEPRIESPNLNRSRSEKYIKDHSPSVLSSPSDSQPNSRPGSGLYRRETLLPFVEPFINVPSASSPDLRTHPIHINDSVKKISTSIDKILIDGMNRPISQSQTLLQHKPLHNDVASELLCCNTEHSSEDKALQCKTASINMVAT